MNDDLQTYFPVVSSLLPEAFTCRPAAALPRLLRKRTDLCPSLPFLADLADLELAAGRLREQQPPTPHQVRQLSIRPGVELLRVDWIGLPEFLQSQDAEVLPGDSFILLVPPIDAQPVRIITPHSTQLLALKIAAEQLDPRSVAEEAGTTVDVVDRIVAAAVRQGLLLAPTSRIVRPRSFFRTPVTMAHRLRAEVFTLQWHITQACDLHCRHCYDRSNRKSVSHSQGLQVLDHFYTFCRDNHVNGQVSFTGGNPLLHHHFFEFYREAVDRGFMVAILGNPTDRSTLEALIRIRKPEFYQVSLEGLREHNDFIRGEGHYDRVIAFLARARAMSLYTMVMLTLTRDNCDQVLPLAEALRDHTDLFTFNRLAMMGEGAALTAPPIETYQSFLIDYLQASRTNPIMSTKDSLFNIVLQNNEQPLRGGCTGFGCGAAFNFVSLLPDGELHACRKLPSLLGNMYEKSLSDIYRSPLAERYREGSSACLHCRLHPVCRGCPAVSRGMGNDIFTDKDPYCFLPDVEIS